jgi:two-component system alkaline phosphatase synthesis response regulator PhoP
MKPLVFSVEDDLNIQNVIKIALENSQFEIESFSNASEMFKRLEEKIPNLFLLDIMLPDTNGLEIIKKLKKLSSTKLIPIMVISAKTSEIDRVIGIDLGADDYLIKPFGVLELISRAKALLRRNNDQSESEIIKINDLVLNKTNLQTYYKEKPIPLTRKQFELLKYLMEKNNQVITRTELLNVIWGYDFVGESRTLDVHINILRTKLKNAGIKDDVIETNRGIGYKLSL